MEFPSVNAPHHAWRRYNFSLNFTVILSVSIVLIYSFFNLPVVDLSQKYYESSQLHISSDQKTGQLQLSDKGHSTGEIV